MGPVRCPLCKAENTNPPTCRRCKADLGLLFTWQRQQQAEAVKALLERDFARALACWRSRGERGPSGEPRA